MMEGVGCEGVLSECGAGWGVEVGGEGKKAGWQVEAGAAGKYEATPRAGGGGRGGKGGGDQGRTALLPRV